MSTRALALAILCSTCLTLGGPTHLVLHLETTKPSRSNPKSWFKREVLSKKESGLSKGTFKYGWKWKYMLWGRSCSLLIQLKYAFFHVHPLTFLPHLNSRNVEPALTFVSRGKPCFTCRSLKQDVLVLVCCALLMMILLCCIFRWCYSCLRVYIGHFHSILI